MEWFIMGVGLALLFFLFRRTRPASGEAQIEIPFDASPEESVRAAARMAREGARLALSRRLLRTLESRLTALAAFPAEDWQPAARVLCENGRFLQLEAAAVLQKRSALACAPRACLFARAWLSANGGVVRKQDLQSAVAAWQELLPMTHAELEALPHALRFELLGILSSAAQESIRAQKAVAAAQRAHARMQRGQPIDKTSYADSTAFVETLYRLHAPEEALRELLHGQSAEQLAEAEHEKQAERALLASHAVRSLHALHHTAWPELLEGFSPVHQAFEADSVYRAMDMQSRAEYRKRVAQLARSCRRTEQEVCTAVLTLCEGAQEDSAEGHIGYYLLDEGLPRLLSRLSPLPLFTRLSLWRKRHALGLWRLLTAALGLGVSWLGLRAGLPVFLLPAWALVMLHALRRILLPRKPSPILPRIALSEIPAHARTLVICPVTLTDPAQALSAVKHMQILHEAEPDPNLHFLLLGDFEDGLSATLGTDEAILHAAFSAVHALREATGHPFDYLHRERFRMPAQRGHCSRGRRAGGVETVLRLIEGQPIEDRFAYATLDPAALQGAYRYAILLDEDTLLPPDGAKQLIGTLLHPLHMRGLCAVQARVESAAHQMGTPLAAYLRPTSFARFPLSTHRASFRGQGIVDVSAFLSALPSPCPEACWPSAEWLAGERGGCAFATDIVLYERPAQTLRASLALLHRDTRTRWQLLTAPLDSPARAKRRLAMAQGLIAPLRLPLLLESALSGRTLIWLCLLLLPELPEFHPAAFWLSLAALPFRAYIQADAIVRTLYRLLVSRRDLMDWTTVRQAERTALPPATNGAGMACGAICGAAALLLHPFRAECLALALLWMSFPLFRPCWERERARVRRPTEYMRDVLLRLARHTWTFFETVMTDEDHALPPARLQLEPGTGVAHHTGPAEIGLYLCSLIAAEKLGLLPAEALAKRMTSTLDTLEKLEKWNDLPFAAYDTQTLEPLSPRSVSAPDCGYLAVALLACAQGVRTALPDETLLSARLDALARAMPLERLYDPSAGLFIQSLSLPQETSVHGHCDLLASEALLLSFAAIVLRRVPQAHWYRLARPLTASRALLSRHGSMSEYLAPFLFLPSSDPALLTHSAQIAIRRQKKRRLSGAWGVSGSEVFSFDPELNYPFLPAGLSTLALDSSAEDDVLAPYASMLALPMEPYGAFRNLQRLQMLGLEGSLGLFEAADFHPLRTEGHAPRIVRSLTTRHQGMILCALCNALCDGYLVKLFSSLSCVQAHRFLLDEKAPSGRSVIRRPLRLPVPQTEKPSAPMKRAAQPLRFPVDAHLLSGGGSGWLLNAQGGSGLWHEGIPMTRFEESCRLPSGMRFYLRDSQSGAYWTVTDPRHGLQVSYESAEAVFTHTRFEIGAQLRLWIHPLDGCAVAQITLENRSGMNRMMEVASFLEPALSAAEQPELRTERISHCGVCAVRRGMQENLRLDHLLVSDVPFSMLRIQCDRDMFLGRGRTFHAPRALEMPISAVADFIGDTPEPCMSLRGQFLLHAGETARFFFLLCLTKGAEDSHAFLERYTSAERVVQTAETAQTRSAVTARFWELDTHDEETISRMTGAVFYTEQPFQARPLSLRALPVFELEGLGVDPAKPLLLTYFSAGVNRKTLRLLLRAHAFWRMSGLQTQLVFKLPDASSAALAAEMEEIAEGCGCPMGENGVLLLSHQEADVHTLLAAAARLIVDGSLPLEGQLEALVQELPSRPLYLCRPSAEWKPVLPEGAETWMENGFGGFTREGHYQITLPVGAQTPAPWRNPLCNAIFGTLASESGLLCSYAGNLRTGRMTRAAGDRGDEAFFLRDPENRLLWSVTRQPLGHTMPVRVTHACGETTYESSAYGLYAKLVCFTDSACAFSLRTLTLKNTDEVPRTLHVFHSCVFHPLAFLRGSGGQLRAYCPENGGWVCLCAVDPVRCTACSMSAGAFQGLYHNAPLALSTQEALPDTGGNAALLSFVLRLDAGESCTLTTAIGFAESEEKLNRQLDEIRRDGAGKRLHETRRMWESRLGQLQFDLPDAALSLMLSRWLPYQVQTGLWMGVHAQPLCEAAALLFTQPDEMRRLLEPAQETSDSSTPMALARYVEATGDSSLLEVVTESAEETLLTRCLHRLEAIESGAHDLPLDSADTESAVLGMELCETIRLFAPLCPPESQEKLLKRREALLSALERFAWDGGWYLRGYRADGQKLGGAECAEGRITCDAQSRAVLCGVSRDRCAAALEHAWRSLCEPDTGLCKCLTPPYRASNAPEAFRLPGFGANGGQLTAEASRFVSALHQAGQDERAWELALRLLPCTHAAARQLAMRYRAEPYAMAGTIIAALQQRGRGGETWLTGGAGEYWQCVVHQLLGLRRTGDRLRFRPVAPKEWDQIRITYRYGTSTYHLHALRACQAAISEGCELTGGVLTLRDDGRIHEATFPLR